MKKLKKSLLLISMLVLYGMAYTALIKAAEPSQVIPPKDYVTFNWVDETNKQFWVNNSYIRLFMDGTQGIGFNDLRHKSNLAEDLLDDMKMVVVGPEIGWLASRWPDKVPLANINVSFTQVSPSFVTLNVTGITVGNILKYTFLLYIGDSEAMMVHSRVTFLKDTNVTEMGHEFVPAYMASLGSEVGYVNSTGYVNIWKLTGDGAVAIFANTTAGTFPLAENWLAVWNTTRNLSAGMIFLNQSMLLNPLGKTAIGLWDGATWDVVSLFGKWYFDPATPVLIKAGSVFEDIVFHWVSTGDYTDIRNLAGIVGAMALAFPPPAELMKLYSELLGKYDALKDEYDTYKATYNVTWTTYKTELQALQDDLDTLQDDFDALQDDFDALQDDYNSYQATHNVTWTDYESLKADLDAAKSAQIMYIVVGLIVGVVVGVGVGWVVGKRRK